VATVAAMVLTGAMRLTEILIMGETDCLCFPCGSGSQCLSEFGAEETPVHICGPEGLRQTMTLGALLPLAFNPKNLLWKH
jgi:cytidine deaminase